MGIMSGATCSDRQATCLGATSLARLCAARASSDASRKGAIMSTPRSTSRSPWLFFALIFILATPLWLLRILSDQGLLKNLGINLPLNALIFVCPLIAAVVLVYREEKLAGVGRLLRRVFDYQRIKPSLWYAPILLLLPTLYVLSYGIQRLLGTPLPAPQMSFLMLPILFALFFLSAACEEEVDGLRD